jgi:cytochrome bd-type quinol oxidase subunit 2
MVYATSHKTLFGTHIHKAFTEKLETKNVLILIVITVPAAHLVLKYMWKMFTKKSKTISAPFVTQDM